MSADAMSTGALSANPRSAGPTPASRLPAGELDAIAALQVVQATLAAPGVIQAAGAWLEAIGRLRAPPATAMACFRLDSTGQILRPIAGLGATLARLPLVPMSELEHPAVYCLVQGKPCLVADAARQPAPGLAELLTAMKSGPALLAVPLRDLRRGQAMAVLVLSGTVEELRRFQQSAEWSAMLAIFQQMMAQARLREETQGVAQVRGPDQQQAVKAAQRVERELVGRSVVARRLRAEVLAAAESRLSVLITGETGSGKDHAAWLIHQSSARRNKPFVPLNCAAIAPDLIAAELFGAAKGAYTGADRARQGLVAAADGGTLFLDEIGDMPLPLQANLLRVLNEKRYRPLGEVEERSSDFRLICATHQPLRERVREGHFREDLYFRIRQLSLVVPPLRERRADILALAEYAIERHNRDQQGSVAGLSEPAQAVLLKHDFPGNVRELLNLMQVACERVHGPGGIDAATLSSLLAPEPEAAGDRIPGLSLLQPDQALLQISNLPQACEAFERELIASRLRHFDGSRLLTAQSLDIPRRTLDYKCKKFGLEETS